MMGLLLRLVSAKQQRQVARFEKAEALRVV
jgi:hypothetical protein